MFLKNKLPGIKKVTIKDPKKSKKKKKKKRRKSTIDVIPEAEEGKTTDRKTLI